MRVKDSELATKGYNKSSEPVLCKIYGRNYGELTKPWVVRG